LGQNDGTAALLHLIIKHVAPNGDHRWFSPAAMMTFEGSEYLKKTMIKKRSLVGGLEPWNFMTFH